MADRKVWVWVELAEEGRSHRLSLELLTLARKLGTPEAVLLDPGAGDTAVEMLGNHGATAVHLGNDAVYGEYLVDPHAATMVSLIEAESPDLILFPSTFETRDVLARLIGRLQIGVVANAVDVDYAGDGSIAVTAPYGAETVGTVTLDGSGPHMVQIRPKAFPLEEVGGSAEVRPVNVEIGDDLRRVKVLESVVKESEGIELEDAEVVVSGGRGLGNADNYVIVEELASRLQGAPGASRAIVDAGWVPYNHQVGQTGKTVKPKLYIACGISGAIQHLVGMQGSTNIIAINRDEDAPIFDVADLGVVGDVLTIVPALTARLNQEQ